MSATLPFDALGIENAIQRWIVASTGVDGDRVRFQQTWDLGPSRSAPPTVLIRALGMRELSQQGRITIPSIMQSRVTVIGTGPGTVGVDFYPGFSETAQPISIVAGPGDLPAVSAASLLAQLVADLPAGYSAVADTDPAAILINASTNDPAFAIVDIDPAMTTSATVMPRFPTLLTKLYRLDWRIEFRQTLVSGSSTAAMLMAQAQLYRRTFADRAMLLLGWRPAGTLAELPSVPTDRQESNAVLDVSWLGNFTGAQANEIMRVVGLTHAIAS